MSNKDNDNHEHHSGTGGPYNGGKPDRRDPPYQPAEYPNEHEDEIDLIELASHFWNDRKLIAKITGIFVAVGLFIAIFSAVEYQTNAVLMPELQTTQSTAQSLLQKYGGLLGMSGSMPSISESIIYPSFYPKIVQSVPYNVKLMRTPITFASYDTTMTTYDFFYETYEPSLLSYIKQYTIGLPGLVLGLFSGDETAQAGQGHTDIYKMEQDTILNLTARQWEMVKSLKARVNVTVDEMSGLVTLSATMPDPMAAAQLTRAGIHLLIERVKEYRSRKAVQNLKFIREMVKEAKREFQKAQEALVEFRDNNLSLVSARAQARLQELQAAKSLTLNLYNSLRQKLQQAKVRVQTQTPVVSILQPVTVPENESAPNRKLIVIVFLILGVIVALGWSLVRVWGYDMIQEIQAGKTSDSEEHTSLQE